MMNYIKNKVKTVSIYLKMQKYFSSDNKKKHAVVSGASVVGMISALNLEKQNYNVDIYEKRDKLYEREIQWVVRQALINSLSSVENVISSEFIEKVAKPISEDGYISIKQDGTVIKKSPKIDHKYNKIDINTEEMLLEPEIMIAKATKFEEILKSNILKKQHIKFHSGKMTLSDKNVENKYEVLNHKTPDLIIIAEGSNSETRDKVGIKSLPTSKIRKQVAAVFNIDIGGKTINHTRVNKRNGKIEITGIINALNSLKTTIITDIDSQITSAKDIEEELRKIFAETLNYSKDFVDKIKIDGIIKDKNLQIFDFQQKISSVANDGDNLILIGDAVGSNHWSVGGGMQIGAISHQKRLNDLIKKLEIDDSKKDIHLKEYSNAVLKDTQEWGKKGMRYCYPELNKYFTEELYSSSLADYIEGKVENPLQAINKKLQNLHLSI